jgi:hypothetical protein
MPDGWEMRDWPAIAVRPSLLGLPLGYAALLMVICGELVLAVGHWGAAAVIFFSGWGVGKLLTAWDPFFWEIGMAARKQPRALVS